MPIHLPASHPAVRKLAKQAKKKPSNLPILRSQLEETFLGCWRIYAADSPQPVREYRFHPVREWRLDFAWPDQKLAVEIEGGIWNQGGHNSPTGFLGDVEKYNALTEAGWHLLRFAQPHVEDQPFAMIEQVKRCLALYHYADYNQAQNLRLT